jgi:hypothetical protein
MSSSSAFVPQPSRRLGERTRDGTIPSVPAARKLEPRGATWHVVPWQVGFPSPPLTGGAKVRAYLLGSRERSIPGRFPRSLARSAGRSSCRGQAGAPDLTRMDRRRHRWRPHRPRDPRRRKVPALPQAHPPVGDDDQAPGQLSFEDRRLVVPDEGQRRAAPHAVASRGAARTARCGRCSLARRPVGTRLALAEPALSALYFCHMSHTITIRLTKELAAWLEYMSAKTGVSQGKIVRDQLEKARAGAPRQSFMRLAGSIRGPRDLSSRKGFSRP